MAPCFDDAQRAMPGPDGEAWRVVHEECAQSATARIWRRCRRAIHHRRDTLDTLPSQSGKEDRRQRPTPPQTAQLTPFCPGKREKKASVKSEGRRRVHPPSQRRLPSGSPAQAAGAANSPPADSRQPASRLARTAARQPHTPANSATRSRCQRASPNAWAFAVARLRKKWRSCSQVNPIPPWTWSAEAHTRKPASLA